MSDRTPVSAAPAASPSGDTGRELTVQELLDEILTRIKDVLAVDTVSVLGLDEPGSALVAQAAKGLEEEVEQHVRIPVGRGFAGRIVAERTAVVIEDVERADVVNPIIREKGVKSLLGAPIMVGGEIVGVLHVGSLTPRRFMEGDVRLLELVAGGVALPLVQHSLYREEREARARLDRARKQLSFLADASGVLASSLDYETTLASVAKLAVPELADWCVIDLATEDGEVRRVAVVCADPARRSDAEELRRTYPSRPRREEGTPKVLETGRPELVQHVSPEWLAAIATDERQRSILRGLGLRSNILVPLTARGRALGVLTLATAESRRRYDESDLRLAEELAGRAALAVDNARLYREAEETLGLLDALFATAPVGLAFLDRTLRYRRVNDTLAAFSGLTPEEHVGRRPGDVTPVLGEEAVARAREVLERGEPVLEREVQGRTSASEEERFWLGSYYPVRAADGEMIGVGLVVADVTDRRKSERRLAAQHEVTRILSDAPSLEDAASRFLAAMGEHLDWEIGGFWQLDEDGRSLRLLGTWRVPDIEARPFLEVSRELRLEPGKGIPGRVWADAEPLWVDDLDRDPNFARLDAGRVVGLRTAFAFPVVLGSAVLGVVEFFSRRPRSPEPDLLAMTGAVGAQIGQFVERKRAERASELARERLSFLAEASELLASSLDFETTLDSIARLAVPRLADWCVVDMLEQDGTLRRVALAHADPEKVALAERLAREYPDDPDSQQGAYSVVRTGEPQFMREIPEELLVEATRDERHIDLIPEIGLRSYVSVPLRTRHGVVGVISLVTAESGRTYDQEDLEFAQELARRASAAVENAILFRDATANEEQQRFLAEAGSVLASSLDYHGTLQSVARLAVPAFADWCIVDVVEGGEIHRVAVAAADQESEDALEELRVSYPPSYESPQPAAHALRAGKPVIYHEFTEESLAATTRDKRHFELMKSLGPRSAVAVPLVARGHTVGAITFASAASGNLYDESDLPLAEEIARRAALAVDNARLYRETEDRARAALVLSHVGDGVFMLDVDGVVRLWNPAAEAITGLSEADVAGRRADDAIPGWPAVGPRVPVAGAPAPAAARAETLPLEIGDRELWLSISGVALEEGTVYAFRDLTEERALEKIRSDFVATVSHELRTPLASVYGAALTLTGRGAELGEEHRERLLAVIAGESERLARIVNDVLLASRLDSEQLVFVIERCDAVEAVRSAVEAARTSLPEQFALHIRPSDPAPEVAADPEKLRQVLGNLIDNAVKYSPQGGTIEVGVEQRGPDALFFVRDDGIGIPPEEHERIFEKFYRLDPELLQGVGGTGLGLYISRELVSRMGGRIWVESRLGAGSSFYFELPAADPVVAVPAGDGVTSEARA